MMIDALLATCNSRFTTERHKKPCDNCNYIEKCPSVYNECERCLERIHFPSRFTDGLPPRKYDCVNMADYYTCKYTHKYTSELIYALNNLKDLIDIENIKILSFGCGPCTDLLALDYLREANIYSYNNLEYRGVDYSKNVWKNIHKDIKNECLAGTKVRFFYDDACKIIDDIADGQWVPHLVVFQYFFSDMNKNADIGEVTSFINRFAEYANMKMPLNSYIVMNDINLSTMYGGGREYFDKLLTLMDKGLYYKGYFKNNSRPTTYKYGREFEKNNLFFETRTVSRYNPFESCSSAQMIFKKGVEVT